MQRATSYGTTKTDYVRAGEGRLKKLSVDKGLLRETESIQEQIRALLRCDVSTYASPKLDSPIHLGFALPFLTTTNANGRQFLSHEAENDISLTAFRLLTMDLLILFHVMNEGMVNILGKFSKPR